MTENNENPEAGEEQGAEEEPQVYNAEKDLTGWKFSRRGFLTAAATAATGAATAAVVAGSKAKKVSAQPVEVVADFLELGEAEMKPGQLFTRVWRVKNNTDAAWGEDAMLNLKGPEEIQIPASIALPNAAPGEIVDIRVEMVAPTTQDDYRIEASFNVTGTEHIVYFPKVMRLPTKTPTPTPTKTPTPTRTPTPSRTPCACHGVCSCDDYSCTCDAVCTCDTVCTCDLVHYWYPC
jgi:hypothetical protein